MLKDIFVFGIGLKSSQYPTDMKEQQSFVFALIGTLIKRVLDREVEYSIKIWTVEHRRMARGSTDVLIPAVEVNFADKTENAIAFRKGASTRAKSKEIGFEGVYFSLYVGLQTRVRIEVGKIRQL
jgi:hypothetical protein